jgi:hypothetical protein
MFSRYVGTLSALEIGVHTTHSRSPPASATGA